MYSKCATARFRQSLLSSNLINRITFSFDTQWMGGLGLGIWSYAMCAHFITSIDLQLLASLWTTPFRPELFLEGRKSTKPASTSYLSCPLLTWCHAPAITEQEPGNHTCVCSGFTVGPSQNKQLTTGFICMHTCTLRASNVNWAFCLPGFLQYFNIVEWWLKNTDKQ
jgi:hypothetical protein